MHSAPVPSLHLPACLPADASDAEVMLMLMGHKLLPSEGDKSVLGQVRDQFSLPAVSVGQATLLQAEGGRA